MQRLLLLGLNHTTAPLELREKLAFTAHEGRAALEAFAARFPSSEAVLLSTCNRVELYIARAVHGHPRVEEMCDFLGESRQCDPHLFRTHLYEKTDQSVVDHLFHVASSLDSMVLGETQILGQVRQAYELSNSMRLTGSLLNPLFQRALAAGKEVMSATSLGEGRLSVASVAVSYAKQIFENFSDKTVLSIGAGKMSQLVLRHFAELSPKMLLVSNRDVAKAAQLAAEFGGVGVSLDRLTEQLAMSDVVITSTAAPQPIITRKMFEGVMKARRYRPIFLIDIALPRDVEPSVGKLENVYLYNLDDMQQAISGTQSLRKDAIEQADAIVKRHVSQFATWHRAREMGPVIDELYRRYHTIAKDELDRTMSRLPNLSDAEKQHLEDLTRRIVNKLLHDPIKQLRESDGLHAPTNQYLHALEKLFHLDASPSAEATDRDPPEQSR